ncbi:MAG: c-type cytochrome [Ignavibacteria bacterium]|nr:c-type cytochrome [Ignavibacteria bacterium]
MKNLCKLLLPVIALMMLNIHLFSEETKGGAGDTAGFSMFAGILVFLLIAIMFIIFFKLSSPKYIYTGEKVKGKLSFFSKISAVINRGVPVERESDIMIGHEYDGIKELNNTIPPWFNFIFYGTILLAIVYMIDYHVLGSGSVMLDEYLSEMKTANDKREELIRTGALINPDNVTLSTDAADLEKGKQIYTTNCTPCHGPDGGGTVGPNLTDQNWIHGGGIKNVFITVTNGVPAKGMIAWKTLLTPKQIQQVSSYVLSLQGTKPANGKPPEGEIWADTVKTSGKDSVKITDSSKVKTDTLKQKNNSSKIKKDSIK